MNKKTKNSTKRRILDTALDLFRKNGYDNVTILNICEKCGITKSTFYYYFNSKDSILGEFKFSADIYVEENFNMLITSTNYVEQLWNFYETYAIYSYNIGVEIKKQLIISNFNKDHHYFAPGDVKLWETEKLLLQKAQESGQIFNTTHPQELAETLVYSLEGISMVWCIKDGDLDYLTKIRQVFETILMIKPGYFEN